LDIPWRNDDAWWEELDALGGVAEATAEQVIEIRDRLAVAFDLVKYKP